MGHHKKGGESRNAPKASFFSYGEFFLYIEMQKCYNTTMQIWFIGRTLASQAGEAGSTPVICFLYGVLAQLGARNIRIVEAVGSNPICSIICGKEGPTKWEDSLSPGRRPRNKKSELGNKSGFYFL